MSSPIASTLSVIAILFVSSLSATDAVAGTSCGLVSRTPHHSHSSFLTHGHQHLRLGIAGSFTHCGLKVLSVDCGSVAEQLGLEPGDIILAINGRSVTCRGDLQRGLRDASHSGRLVLRVEDSHGRVTRLVGRIVSAVPEIDLPLPPPAPITESF